MSTSPSKSTKQFWKNFLNNPKSLSSDIISSSRREYTTDPSNGLLRRPMISKRAVVTTPATEINVGSKEKGPTNSKYKNYRDDFVLKKHGFTGSVFGVALSDSLEIASAEVIVQIELVSFGRIPIVVAKCGAYLKAKALETSGIFRIAGSSKRVKELQHIFSTPPDYGTKFNNFDSYTVHDIASLLRRYLNNLSEPLIPLSLYDNFRTPLQKRPKVFKYIQTQNIKNYNNVNENKPTDGVIQESTDVQKTEEVPILFDEMKKRQKRKKKHLAKSIKSAIKEYELLLVSLSNDTKQLTIYLLDLLSLFSRQSDKNLMTAKNLSAIFQPSLLSHPQHDMDPHEYELSRVVVEFLIEYSYKLLPYLLKLTNNEQRKLDSSGFNVDSSDITTNNTLEITEAGNVLVKNTQGSKLSQEDSHTEATSKNDTSNSPSDKNITFPTKTSDKFNKVLVIQSHRRPYSRSIGSVVVPPDMITSDKRRTRLLKSLQKPDMLSDSGANEDEDSEVDEDEDEYEEYSDAYVGQPSTGSVVHPLLHVTNGDDAAGEIDTQPHTKSPASTKANTDTENRDSAAELVQEERAARSQKRTSWFQRLRSRSRSSSRR